METFHRTVLSSRLGAKGISTSRVVPWVVWPTCGTSTTFSTVCTLVLQSLLVLPLLGAFAQLLDSSQPSCWRKCTISGLSYVRGGSPRSSQWSGPDKRPKSPLHQGQIPQRSCQFQNHATRNHRTSAKKEHLRNFNLLHHRHVHDFLKGFNNLHLQRLDMSAAVTTATA